MKGGGSETPNDHVVYGCPLMHHFSFKDWEKTLWNTVSEFTNAEKNPDKLYTTSASGQYRYALRITHVFNKKSIETYIFPDLGDQEALLMSSERFLRPIFSMIGWPFCRQTHSSGLFLDPEHYLWLWSQEMWWISFFIGIFFFPAPPILWRL